MKFDPRFALGALILIAGCGQADDKAAGNSTDTSSTAAVAAPNGADWTETTAISPVGGFVMGNPDAKVKLVEYGSLTCSHCADFAKNGVPKLRELVKAGTVSWEFRPFLLNVIDVPASLLAGCQGAAPFFKLSEQLYAQQHEWVAKFQEAPPAEMQRIQSLPPKEAFGAIAKVGALDTWFKVRGVPQARIDACLSDDKALTQLEAIQKQGATDKVTGTPAFLINGALVTDAANWETLEPKLKAAIG